MTKGFTTPVHWHPQDELFKVLKGSLGLGFGRRLNRHNATILNPGVYGWVPGKSLHYTWSDGPAVLEIQGIGPFKTFHAHPASESRRPSNNKKRAR